MNISQHDVSVFYYYAVIQISIFIVNTDIFILIIHWAAEGNWWTVQYCHIFNPQVWAHITSWQRTAPSLSTVFWSLEIGGNTERPRSRASAPSCQKEPVEVVRSSDQDLIRSSVRLPFGDNRAHPASRRPRGRPRACGRNYISHQKVVVVVERDFWNSFLNLPSPWWDIDSKFYHLTTWLISCRSSKDESGNETAA